jgi:hypothetical protein
MIHSIIPSSWLKTLSDLFIRWCFNVTLLLAGIFGLAAGGSPNFIALASLLALVGVGVGGTSEVQNRPFKNN